MYLEAIATWVKDFIPEAPGIVPRESVVSLRFDAQLQEHVLAQVIAGVGV